MQQCWDSLRKLMRRHFFAYHQLRFILWIFLGIKGVNVILRGPDWNSVWDRRFFLYFPICTYFLGKSAHTIAPSSIQYLLLTQQLCKMYQVSSRDLILPYYTMLHILSYRKVTLLLSHRKPGSYIETQEPFSISVTVSVTLISSACCT